MSGGELTPTLKVRRHLVVERWARPDRRDVRHPVGADTRSDVRTSVRQFVQFDVRERLGPIRVIAHDVILDLVVVDEP